MVAGPVQLVLAFLTGRIYGPMISYPVNVSVDPDRALGLVFITNVSVD